MKSLFIALALIGLNCHAKSQDPTLPEATHSAVLNFLSAKVGAIDSNEDRTFYFAGQNGTTMQIANTAGDVTVFIGQPDDGDQGPMSDSLTSRDQHDVQVRITATGDLEVQMHDYFDDSGPHQLYSESMAVLSPSAAGLQARAVESEYWDLDSRDSDSSKWRWVHRESPKVQIAESDMTYVLSLSAADIDKMGQIAAKKVEDTREPSQVECTLQSATEINCSYYLDTDYTPDTLHAKFSIENGKIGKLTDVELEPGC